MTISNIRLRVLRAAPAYLIDRLEEIQTDTEEARDVALAALGRYSPTILDFGAEDDDSVDNIDAIQAAVDAAGDAGGGVVYVPQQSGDFWRIGRSIIMRSGVNLVLASPETHIYCDASAAGFGRFPMFSCVLFGSWETSSWDDSTKYDGNAIAISDTIFDCATAAEASNFQVGDCIGIIGATDYGLGGSDLPTIGQMNVVLAVNTSNGNLTLRYPIDFADAAPRIVNLSRDPSTLQMNPPLDTNIPQWATRDAAIIGGTWSSIAGFITAGGGAINCHVDVHATYGVRPFAYGNTFAYCTFRQRVHYITPNSVQNGSGPELAFLSHDTIVEIDTLIGQQRDSGVTDLDTAFCWINQGARRCSITVHNLNLGPIRNQRLASIQGASQCRILIGSALAYHLTASPFYIYDAAVDSGTPPDTKNNFIGFDLCDVGTSNTYLLCAALVSDNTGYFFGNVIGAWHTGGGQMRGSTSNAAGLYFNCGAGTASGFLNLVIPDGALAYEADVSGVFVDSCYVNDGVGNSGDWEFLTKNNIRLTSFASGQVLPFNLTYDTRGVTAAATFAKTISLPIGAAAGGDRIAYRLAGTITGTNGDKTFNVAFAGSNLINQVFGAADTGAVSIEIDIYVEFFRIAVFADYRIWRAGALVAQGITTVSSLNLATTAYDFVHSVVIAHASDSFALRGATIRYQKPGHPAAA